VSNTNNTVVEAFGQEWSKFDQNQADPTELCAIFDLYFAIFPWAELSRDAIGLILVAVAGVGLISWRLAWVDCTASTQVRPLCRWRRRSSTPTAIASSVAPQWNRFLFPTTLPTSVCQGAETAIAACLPRLRSPLCWADRQSCF
jgi:hypothetical protein